MLQVTGQLFLNVPHLVFYGCASRRKARHWEKGGEIAHHFVYVGMNLGAVEDGQVQRHAAPSAP